MAKDIRPTFNRQSILEKQKQVKEDYEGKLNELRRAFEQVAATPSGEKVLRYLFLLCGGDSSMVRREKDGTVSMDETLLVLGAKSVYDTIRHNLSSNTLKQIERHNWED